MSGGHWDYVGYRIHDELRMIGTDEEAVEKWPVTTAMFAALSEVLHEAEHQMDYALSGDTESPSDLPMAERIVTAVLTAAPNGWFPRGKWATIQAIQDRVR